MATTIVEGHALDGVTAGATHDAHPQITVPVFDHLDGPIFAFGHGPSIFNRHNTPTR